MGVNFRLPWKACRTYPVRLRKTGIRPKYPFVPDIWQGLCGSYLQNCRSIWGTYVQTPDGRVPGY